MTDEQGHPLPDTPAPQPGTGAEPANQSPDVPTESGLGAGTPGESLDKRLRDKDSHIGKLSKELDDLKNEVGFYRQQMAQAQGFGPAAPPSPQGFYPQNGPVPYQQEQEKFNWDDPLRTVDSRLDKKLTDFAAQMTVQQSFNMAQFAEMTARQSDPALFNEVGDQVRNVMIQGIRSRTVDPRVVSDPEMWKTMAWVAYGQKRGYKLGNQVNPLQPTVTESPTGNRSVDDDGTTLDSSARAMISKWGESEGDVAKILKEDKKRRG